MEKAMQIANSPMMWILASLIISVVVFQTIVFFNLAKTYIKNTDILTPHEVKTALKVGAVGTIGPAVAVFTVAVVLIGLIGGPITLSRVGIIGSAAFESLAASVGSGGTVGTEAFTPNLLATASWVMTLGGGGWLITTFIMTKTLDSTQRKFSKSNPKIIKYIASFAPFIVFFVYSVQESVNGAKGGSYGVAAAALSGAVSMYVLNKLSKKDEKYRWLREWSMGFAIIVAMIFGNLVG